jgi:hypothetical protein
MVWIFAFPYHSVQPSLPPARGKGGRLVLGLRQFKLWYLLPTCMLGLNGAWCQSVDTLGMVDKNVQVNRDPARLDANQSEIVLYAKEWQGRQLSLADILAEQAGIETRRYGGLGSFQTVSLRGSASAQVEVYMDDVPLHSAGCGWWPCHGRRDSVVHARGHESVWTIAIHGKSRQPRDPKRGGIVDLASAAPSPRC